jgi:glucosamine 6-phosphate synthetase-like amidotransferase/phosphosugar isomerase protein
MFAVLGAADAEIAGRVRHVVEVPEATGMLGVIFAALPLHLLAYHFATIRAGLSSGDA